MVVEEVVNASVDLLPSAVNEILMEVGKVALFLQALGFIVVLWIIFQIVNLVFNRKRTLAVYQFKEDIQRLEKKIDRIEKLVRKK